MKITKETTIAEALKYPKVREVLAKYGIGCLFCPMVAFERIEDIARVHGIDVEKILKEMNEAIEKD